MAAGDKLLEKLTGFIQNRWKLGAPYSSVQAAERQIKYLKVNTTPDKWRHDLLLINQALDRCEGKQADHIDSVTGMRVYDLRIKKQDIASIVCTYDRYYWHPVEKIDAERSELNRAVVSIFGHKWGSANRWVRRLMANPDDRKAMAKISKMLQNKNI